MINITRLTLSPEIISRLRLTLTYFSILLFIALAATASLSVRNYISDTMSITLAEPEQIDSDELASEAASNTVTVKKGDTLKTILIHQGLPSNDIAAIIKIAENLKISSTLKIGQQLVFDYDMTITEEDESDLATESQILTKLTFIIDRLNSLEITRVNDNFVAKNTTISVNKFLSKSSTVINSSFMSALKKLGLGTSSIIELVNHYSYQIDFQRQIQPGDTITVITEKFVTDNGEFSHHGKILYASLNSSGKEYNIYRYSHDDSPNNYNFFSENGKSVKRNLLRTPVNLIKISSHYGKRKHPILGFTKMHKGVDFAAPTGTSFYAAGDGVITEIGWRSGYGKFIQIKHSPTLSTAYAHANNFAKNLKRGSKVKQGQVIGYVGQTGRTTASHLHYEVKIDGRNVNPMSIKTTPGIELSGSRLAKFKEFKTKIKTLSAELKGDVKVTENSNIATN